MALHMRLMVNDHQIGTLMIRRVSPKGSPSDDDICLYDWYMNDNGVIIGNLADNPVSHRYGDGAWALLEKVINKYEAR